LDQSSRFEDKIETDKQELSINIIAIHCWKDVDKDKFVNQNKFDHNFSFMIRGKKFSDFF
jgi:hypothetical protein